MTKGDIIILTQSMFKIIVKGMFIYRLNIKI